MNVTDAAKITRERLQLWQQRTERDGIASTPMILLNVRHEDGHLGELVIQMTEDISDEQAIAVLEGAAQMLRRQR